MNAAQLLDALGTLDEALLEDVNRARSHPRPKPVLWRKVASIAAVFMLLVTAAVVILHISSGFQMKYTAEDAAENLVGTTDYETYSNGYSTDDQYIVEEPGDGCSTPPENSKQPYVTVKVTSQSNNHLLGVLCEEHGQLQKGQTVEILIENKGDCDFAEGTFLSVQYSRIDTGHTPALVYAQDIRIISES